MSTVIDGDVMLKLCPKLDRQAADAWGESLQAGAEEFQIEPAKGVPMWLAQLCHESVGFTKFVENMNYSAKRMAQVWPGRYAVDSRAIDKQPNALALFLGGKPDCVANDVYARRMGNGEPSSGDGWKFRGRYPAQLTGRENYTLCGYGTQLNMIEDPDIHLLSIPAMGRISAWFWWHKSLNRFADEGDFGSVVKTWNGGTIGLEDRIAWHKRALDALGIA